MSHEERTGERDLTYSNWHRPNSTRRFMSRLDASMLSMIDLDDLEPCQFCKAPLALIETKHFKAEKRSTVYTAALGEKAGVPVFLVIYTPNEASDDITLFEVQEAGSAQMVRMTPQEYANWLLEFRLEHMASCTEMSPKLKKIIAESR